MNGIVVPTLRRDDRVRVVLEGPVVSISPGPGGFEVGDGFDSNWIVPTHDHVVSIEKLVPNPRVGDKMSVADFLSRKFAVGTVIRDIADGDTMMWDGDVWYSSLLQSVYSNEELAGFDEIDGYEVVYVPVTA